VGQNTCVSLFKDAQLNLVAVSKWSLTEELRGIKKLWDYCSEIIGLDTCGICTNHTVTRITRIMLDSFEHSIRLFGIALKICFGPMDHRQFGNVED
jgi:hypothetical protein